MSSVYYDLSTDADQTLNGSHLKAQAEQLSMTPVRPACTALDTIIKNRKEKNFIMVVEPVFPIEQDVDEQSESLAESCNRLNKRCSRDFLRGRT